MRSANPEVLEQIVENLTEKKMCYSICIAECYFLRMEKKIMVHFVK